jgi:hypothetical protein
MARYGTNCHQSLSAGRNAVNQWSDLSRFADPGCRLPLLMHASDPPDAHKPQSVRARHPPWQQGSPVERSVHFWDDAVSRFAVRQTPMSRLQQMRLWGEGEQWRVLTAIR